jgi:hypothetical protein
VRVGLQPATLCTFPGKVQAAAEFARVPHPGGPVGITDVTAVPDRLPPELTASDGRALTRAIISPGIDFGEMVLLGQRMYDNFAEALDDITVCVMSRARISARITEILGRRLTDLEQRLSDSVFKSVPLGAHPDRGGASPPPC